MAVLGHGLPNLEDACRSVKACLSKVDCFWRFKTEVQKLAHVGEETCDKPRRLVPKRGKRKFRVTDFKVQTAPTLPFRGSFRPLADWSDPQNWSFGVRASRATRATIHQ